MTIDRIPHNALH